MLGDELKKMRGNNSYYRIAKKARVQANQLKLIEEGKSRNPTYDTLKRIVNAMGYDIKFVKFDDNEEEVKL